VSRQEQRTVGKRADATCVGRDADAAVSSPLGAALTPHRLQFAHPRQIRRVDSEDVDGKSRTLLRSKRGKVGLRGDLFQNEMLLVLIRIALRPGLDVELDPFG